MEVVRVFLTLGIVTFLGWNVLYLISDRGKGLCAPERIAVSYGLGMGVVTLEMLLFYFLKLSFSLTAIMAPWLILFLINGIRLLKGRREKVKATLLSDSGKPHPFLTAFLAGGILFETAYTVFRALIKPLESYDAVAIYAIKSKIFYLAGAIPQDFFTRLAGLFPHPDYPLNIPLAQTLLYLGSGSLNDQLVKTIFPLYFLGILTMLYFAVRRFAGRTYAILFTFLLATIPHFNAYATNGYLEVPLAYYYFLSALFLFRWIADTSQGRYLVLSAVMSALAGWTKNEGIMYCAVNTVVLTVFIFFTRKPLKIRMIRDLFLYIGIMALLLLPWYYIKMTASLHNEEVGLDTVGFQSLFMQWYKIKPILYEFQKEFFGPKKWNIIWPVLLYLLLVNRKRSVSGVGRYAALSIALAIAGYVAVYFASPLDVSYFVS
ncbi:MAG: glycosyltransferase family 39 protein, partial [Candidatus Omnitrophica bacterium]|nr:glycosyltransferase family 39 protein [Candidatus Omnitrophota bacterium]